MNHDALVTVAKNWLSNRMHCSVIITEMASAGGEIPDAIGFQGPVSILVECKASLADFRSDASKGFRAEGMGMGCGRYYLTTPGLIPVDELPPKWGLLELTGRKVNIVRKSETFERNAGGEIALLISALRRIGKTCPEGTSVKCYTIQTLCTSTLGIEPLPEEQPA